MSLPVSVDGGATGSLVGLDGAHLRLVLDRPFAPGQPVSFRADAPDGPLALSGKCIGCKRQEGETFEVRLRPVDIRREQRAALVALLESA